MESVERLVRQAIVGSPFARKLGVTCDAIEPGRARLRLPFEKDATTIGDVVHGGAIASLVDVAATAACWAHPDIPPGARGTTIGLSLNFLQAARGEDLVADARVVQRGKQIVVADVDVRSAGAAAVARALVTYKLSAPERSGR
jgi:uncharacterized protein (TIGR00369 family)